MRETTFDPEEMPILDLDISGTNRHEASRFLDNPEIMAAYIAQSMQAGDMALVHALGEVAKAIGVNKVAQEAGVNRESLYKVLKGGTKTRFETIRKLMTAIGLELTVRPIEAPAAANKPRTVSENLQSDPRLQNRSPRFQHPKLVPSLFQPKPVNWIDSVAVLLKRDCFAVQRDGATIRRAPSPQVQ
jgi:probable addiction module antidote protein